MYIIYALYRLPGDFSASYDCAESSFMRSRKLHKEHVHKYSYVKYKVLKMCPADVRNLLVQQLELQHRALFNKTHLSDRLGNFSQTG